MELTEIQRAKKIFEQYSIYQMRLQGGDQRGNLLETLEEVEKKIEQLQAELQDAESSLHRQGKLNSRESQEEVQQFEQQLTEWTKQKRDLDHILDREEDAASYSTDDLVEEIVNSLALFFPGAAEEGRELLSHKKQSEEAQESFVDELAILEPLVAAAEAAIELRQRRRTTLFAFMFKPSPRSLFARHMVTFQQYTEEALGHLDRETALARVISQLQETMRFSPSFEGFDQEVYPLILELQKEQKQRENALKDLRVEADEFNVSNWISVYCKRLKQEYQVE